MDGQAPSGVTGRWIQAKYWPRQLPSVGGFDHRERSPSGIPSASTATGSGLRALW